MAKKLRIVMVLFTLISCQSKEEKLVGHWHEYKTNGSDYINCYRITDSTIGFNPRSNGGYDAYRRGLDIGRSEIFSLVDEHYNWTSDFTISGDKLIINDSVFWIKQTDERKSFLTDFSAGLLVNISPFESNNSEFDLLPDSEAMIIYIFVGKLKSSVLKRYTKFDKDRYYIQLNDKIAAMDDIVYFVNFGHSDITKRKVFMHVDKNTPTALLAQMEAEMAKVNIRKHQIYYLTINTTELTSGYNRND